MVELDAVLVQAELDDGAGDATKPVATANPVGDAAPPLPNLALFHDEEETSTAKRIKLDPDRVLEK